MKKAWFDGRLYLQGLKRLRVIGLALAILCISISILVPLTTWISTANMVDDYYMNHDPMYGLEDSFSSLLEKEVADRMLIIPVLVASYLSPIFILIMFAYLNKRSESDFYHAIPYTRVCVYTSFVSAALTWVFAILIVGGLSAALFWTMCPYTTYSFGGLICEILLSCLNAAFLASFTAVGVSLAGTESTAVVASLLALCSWRVIMGVAYVVLEDLMTIIDVEHVWGGYLTPQWLLPIGLVGEKETAGSIVYAGIVALAMFALGGLLYHVRRSETAGRAVPGRALQIIFRCLITLPVALILTYCAITGEDVTLLLILLVVSLLIFYLYELLTSKSARSMLRATPWLGAVLAACLIFTGAMFLSKYAILNERIDEDRIEEIGLTRGVSGFDEVAISDYERFLMMEYMSDDPEVISLLAKALQESQRAEKDKSFYNEQVLYTEDGPVQYINHKGFEYLSVCIKLKSGREMGRHIRMPREDYIRFLKALRDDLNLNALPDADMVDHFQVAQFGHSCVQTLDKEWTKRVLAAMRQDHAAMTEEQKREMTGYFYEGISFTLHIKTPKQRFYCNYYLTNAMPNTAKVICEMYLEQQEEAKKVFATIMEEAPATFAEGHEGNLTIGVQQNIMQKEQNYYGVIEETGEQVLEFLDTHVKESIDESQADTCVVLWMTAYYDMIDADGEYVYKHNEFPVPLLLNLSKEEYTTLINLLNNGKP